MRILFWNVNKKSLTGLICDLAVSSEADIIILCECTIPINQTLRALTTNAHPNFISHSNSTSRFHCFSRSPAFDLTEAHKGFRTSIRHLKLGPKWLLLGLIHGADIRNNDSETRQSLAHDLAEEVRFAISQHGHNRVVLIGDFNMNPFDRGMNLPKGLNALMTKNCVARGQRKFAGKLFDLYYNPMWSLFGDVSDGPPGTIYDTSNQGTYGWNMLDQVIISHSILSEFIDVKILTQAGNNKLLNKHGRPDKSNSSDHLPILLILKGTNHD